MNWQPIETAPKDGTLVMFGGAKMRKPIISRADDLWSGLAFWLDEATHWMPLPEPPK